MGNHEIFERMAAGYDTPERIKIAEVCAEAIRHILVNTKSKTALDFGCGTGLVGLNLINEFESILFVDSSQNMINRIQDKISEFEIPNANTLCFNFEEGNLELQVDCIFMAQVLLHIEDIMPVLSRLYNHLNVGGHLIIVDFDKNDAVKSDLVHNGFEQESLKELMDEIGFKNIESKTFYHGEKVFMGCDASMFILHSRK